MWNLDTSKFSFKERYSFRLNAATPSNNTIKEMHFLKYKMLRRKWQSMVLSELGQKPSAPIEQSFILVERFCSGEGLDWDNAYGGLKPLLDCLVYPSKANPDGLGLIRDDNPTAMPYPPFVSQFKTAKGKGYTILKIFEINPL